MVMRPPKKPSQESSLPSQDESRRSNVLMEQMLSKFNTFGESLAHVREDVNSLKPRFDRLEEKVDVLDLAVRTNGRDINALKEASRAQTEAIQSMQSDLKKINGRLDVVETKLAS